MAQLDDSDAASGGVLDTESFKRAMGCFATGVAVVTAVEAGAPVGFTCQSVVSLSLDPAYVALAPAKSSTSWPRIARAGSFCVNVLSGAQEHLGRRFSLSGVDKFPGVAWRPGRRGAPVLAGSIAWVDCDLELVHDAGDHEIVIGRAVSVGFGDLEAAPLLFYKGEFRHFGAPPAAAR